MTTRDLSSSDFRMGTMSSSWFAHSARTASTPFSLIGKGSPMQKTQLKPWSKMYWSFVAMSWFDSLGVGNPNSPRRSEWPMRTVDMPMSLIWSTDISPVYAPQPAKLQFWGATLIPGLKLSLTSATCKFDGHTYTSHLSRYCAQPSKFETSSSSDEAVAGLHFQLPPTMGLRAMPRAAWRSSVRAGASVSFERAMVACGGGRAFRARAVFVRLVVRS